MLGYVMIFSECFGAALASTIFIYFVAYFFDRNKTEFTYKKFLIGFFLVTTATAATRFLAALLFGVPLYKDDGSNNNILLILFFGVPLFFKIFIFSKYNE